jgi:hypothetical protein
MTQNRTFNVDDYIRVSPFIEQGPYRDSIQNLTERLKKARLENSIATIRNVQSTRSLSPSRAAKTFGSGTLNVGQVLNQNFPSYGQLFGKSIYAFTSPEGWDDSISQIFGMFGFLSTMDTAAFQMAIDPNEVPTRAGGTTTHQNVMEALTGDVRQKTKLFSGDPIPGETVGGKVKISIPNPQEIFHLNMTKPPGAGMFGSLNAGSVPDIDREVKLTGHELTHVLTAEAGTRNQTLQQNINQSVEALITPDRKSHIDDILSKRLDVVSRYKKILYSQGLTAKEVHDKIPYSLEKDRSKKIAQRLSTSVDPKLKLSINSPQIQEILQGARAFMHEKVIEEVTAEVGGNLISLRSGNVEDLVQNISKIAGVGYFAPSAWTGYSDSVFDKAKSTLISLADSGLLMGEKGESMTSEAVEQFLKASQQSILDFSGAAFAVGMEDSILSLPDSVDGKSLKEFKQAYLRTNS